MTYGHNEHERALDRLMADLDALDAAKLARVNVGERVARAKAQLDEYGLCPYCGTPVECDTGSTGTEICHGAPAPMDYPASIACPHCVKGGEGLGEGEVVK